MVVKQQEPPWTWLTARETVKYALAFFCHGLQGAELMEATNELLEKQDLSRVRT